MTQLAHEINNSAKYLSGIITGWLNTGAAIAAMEALNLMLAICVACTALVINIFIIRKMLRERTEAKQSKTKARGAGDEKN